MNWENCKGLKETGLSYIFRQGYLRLYDSIFEQKKSVLLTTETANMALNTILGNYTLQGYVLLISKE